MDQKLIVVLLFVIGRTHSLRSAKRKGTPKIYKPFKES